MKRLILPALLLLITACQAPPPAATTPAASTAPAPAEPAEVADGAGVNLENFSKINAGMTLAEVEKILGAPGQELSRVEIEGAPSTVIYQWNGESFSNMNVTFQDEKMVAKAQFNLK